MTSRPKSHQLFIHTLFHRGWPFILGGSKLSEGDEPRENCPQAQTKSLRILSDFLWSGSDVTNRSFCFNWKPQNPARYTQDNDRSSDKQFPRFHRVSTSVFYLFSLHFCPKFQRMWDMKARTERVKTVTKLPVLRKSENQQVKERNRRVFLSLQSDFRGLNVHLPNVSSGKAVWQNEIHNLEINFTRDRWYLSSSLGKLIFLLTSKLITYDWNQRWEIYWTHPLFIFLFVLFQLSFLLSSIRF
jgi:hypothetical protein